jgi:tRNA dimethylallyltransferase
VPLFSGGTALYLKALLFGLFEGPDADPDVRARLRATPPEELHRRLAEVDPASAAKIHQNDVRRLVRALEIHEITGRPPSELRRQWEAERPVRPVAIAGIRRDRADLYRRIDARVDRMIEGGLVDEVRGLLDRPGGLGPIPRQALGYKEIADHIEGTTPTLQEAVEILKRRTRTFARRQLTWFKHFAVRWVDAAPAEDPASIAARVAGELKELRGTDD